jgi:hypothetical protein
MQCLHGQTDATFPLQNPAIILNRPQKHPGRHANRAALFPPIYDERTAQYLREKVPR